MNGNDFVASLTFSIEIPDARWKNCVLKLCDIEIVKIVDTFSFQVILMDCLSFLSNFHMVQFDNTRYPTCNIS